MSVIVPAYRADDTLAACVASLLVQDIAEPYEVILYLSADSPDLLPDVTADPRLVVLTSSSRVRAAVARNRAASVAKGQVLVFTDADVVATTGWLRHIVPAARRGAFVAGAVENGTPRSGPGTTQYLLEFLDYHPNRPVSGLWHGATCNLAVDRALWEQWGPFPEDLEGGEDTLLTAPAHRRGELDFAADAVVVHRNRTSLPAVLRHLHALGRRAAHVARRGDYLGRTVVRLTALAPVAALGRGVMLGWKLCSWARGERRAALRVAPLLVLGLVAWGAGLLAEGRRIDKGRGGGADAGRADRRWEVEGVVPDQLPDGWRRHARRAHADLFARWVGTDPSGTWLKTDLQEERTSVRSVLPDIGGTWVGVDLSSGVLSEASVHGWAGAVADVRHLPFAPGAFAGALSTSTLDHFEDKREIDVALSELRRCLAPGASLVLTLDNPANPLIWLRNSLPPRWRARTGLVPFHVGPTLRAEEARDAVSRAGFEVVDSEHLLHAPHIVCTRAARFRFVERRVLPLLDRVGSKLTASRTGHYVAVLGRVPADEVGQRGNGPRATPSGS